MLMSTPSTKISGSTRLIGEAFYDWLEAEVITSSTEGDINTYLNDFTTIRGGEKDGIKIKGALDGGWDDPKNYLARKLEAHNNRLPHWFEAYTLAPDDDYQAARLSFAGLMQVSGAYRDQCYMEAVDGEDYMNKRQQVIGVDIVQSVADRLRHILPKSGDFSLADVSPESFEDEMKRVSRIGELAVRKMCERARLGFDFSATDTPSSGALRVAQYEWLLLTTDAVALAAKTRGGRLEAVPFLEPRSISEQSDKVPHYPLRPDFPGWAEVMAA